MAGALLLLVAALPSAVAAPVSGSLDVASTLSAGGPSSTSAPDALLVLTNLTTVSSFAVVANETTIQYREVGSMRVRVVPGVLGVEQPTHDRTSEDDFSASTLTLSNPKPDQGLFIAVYPAAAGSASHALSLDTPGQVIVEGKGPGMIRSRDYTPLLSEDDTWAYEFVYQFDRDHLSAGVPPGDVVVEGDFDLYVWAADVNVDGPGGAKTYPTGLERSNETAAGYERSQKWVVAKFRDATLTFQVTEPRAALYADSFATTTAGTVRVDDARGEFGTANATYAVDGQSASLKGNLTLDVAPVRSSEGGASPLPSDAPPRLRVGLSGELLDTSLQGVPVNDPVGLSPGKVAMVAGAASVLSGLGYSLWRGMPFLVGYVVVRRESDLSGFFPFLGRARRVHGGSVGEARRKMADWEDKALAWRKHRKEWYAPYVALFYCRLAWLVAPPEAGARARHEYALALARVGLLGPAATSLVAVLRVRRSDEVVLWDLARVTAGLARRRWWRRNHYAAQAVGALEVVALADGRFLGKALRDPAFRGLTRNARFRSLVEGYREPERPALPLGDSSPAPTRV